MLIDTDWAQNLTERFTKQNLKTRKYLVWVRMQGEEPCMGYRRISKTANLAAEALRFI